MLELGFGHRRFVIRSLKVGAVESVEITNGDFFTRAAVHLLQPFVESKPDRTAPPASHRLGKSTARIPKLESRSAGRKAIPRAANIRKKTAALADGGFVND